MWLNGDNDSTYVERHLNAVESIGLFEPRIHFVELDAEFVKLSLRLEKGAKIIKADEFVLAVTQDSGRELPDPNPARLWQKRQVQLVAQTLS